MSERASEAERRWTPATLPDLQGRSRPAARPAAAQPPPGPRAEDVRKQAYDAGYAEGLAAGRKQAERIATEMATLLDAMATPFRDMDAVLLRELLELTERIVGAVLGREHELGVDLEPVLEEALAALGDATVPVEVILNPRDAQLCRGAGLLDNGQFTLVEDPGQGRGGLQLRAGSSFVDASVAARLEAAISAIRREAGLPESEPVSEPESASESGQEPTLPGPDSAIDVATNTDANTNTDADTNTNTNTNTNTGTNTDTDTKTDSRTGIDVAASTDPGPGSDKSRSTGSRKGRGAGKGKAKARSKRKGKGE